MVILGRRAFKADERDQLEQAVLALRFLDEAGFRF